MANDLTLIERTLTPLAPRFDDVLGGVMTSKHLIQTILVSCERNPKLFAADRQSLLNAALTFANLRLPVDGATGQGFLLPFRDNRKDITIVQPVIGYRGFNTIGARADITITGGVVREGDEVWDFMEGTGGFVRHKKRLDNPGRIIAAWAAATSRTRPAAVSVVGIGEILEIKSRSPAVRFKAETPWLDEKVGFPAMSEKTAKRRLSRVLPFEIDDGRFHKAARLDEAFDEQGLPGRIREDGALFIGDEASPIARREDSPAPDADSLMSGRRDDELETLYAAGKKAAEQGALWAWFDELTKPERAKIQPRLAELRKIHDEA